MIAIASQKQYLKSEYNEKNRIEIDDCVIRWLAGELELQGIFSLEILTRLFIPVSSYSITKLHEIQEK